MAIIHVTILEEREEYAPSSVVPFTLLLEPAGSLYNPPTHSKLLSLVILRTDGRLVRREPQGFRGETLGFLDLHP